MSTATATTTNRHVVIDSPIGPLTLVRDDDGITGLYYPGHWTHPNETTFGPSVETTDDPGFDEAIAQLNEYFAGERHDFDLPLNPQGNDRARRVWQLLAEIPYGQTTTYGALAREVGNGISPRAIGRFVGYNPLSIFIACHRGGRIHRKAHRVCRGSAPQAISPRVGERRYRLRRKHCGETRVKPPFDKVVTQHGPTVLRVVRAVLGHADADDAWSDTFLAAMKVYPDLPADANVEAWLVTIAHRKAIDVVRAASRRADACCGHAGNGVAGSRRRTERRSDRGRCRAADQTTAGGGLSLSRRSAVCRDRRAGRHQPRCRTPRGRRRQCDVAANISITQHGV